MFTINFQRMTCKKKALQNKVTLQKRFSFYLLERKSKIKKISP